MWILWNLDKRSLDTCAGFTQDVADKGRILFVFTLGLWAGDCEQDIQIFAA